MKFEIIPLALRKIKQRGIPLEWVEQTLGSPNQITNGYEGRKVAQKLYNVNDKKMLLRVVYETAEGVRVVITAYLTTQIERYWRKI
ncbi:DUF4258 domain-containing protein [Dehalococcoidia bacterium]|nr:DUF4258 domain-containing protein [Dehalococcoidia bacterium]